MDERDIIDDILDNFDFARVEQTMRLLNWSYHDTEGEPPDQQHLRKLARSLLKACIGKEDYVIGTGGFTVFKNTYDGLPFYRLIFSISDWDNYE